MTDYQCSASLQRIMDAENTLRNLLDEIALQNNYVPNKVEVKHTSSDGANYTSALFTAKISTPEKNDLNLFAKVAILNEKLRAEMKNDLYDRERHFYTELMKVYEEIECENGITGDDKLKYPKFYGSSEVVYAETIILEDLATLGYQNSDRFRSVDWEFASAAVTEAAKLHALSFAYNERNPEEFAELLEKRKFIVEGNDDDRTMYTKMVESALGVLDEEQRVKYQKFLEESQYGTSIQKFYSPLGRPVLIHGDFRPSNMMFKNQDGKTEIMTVDFQTIQSGCPLSDLIYFIISGTDQEFRRRHFKQLIDHYYSELQTALRRLKLDITELYPRDKFDEDWEYMLPYGLIVSLFILPIITVNADVAPDLNRKDADINSFVIKPNELFAIRMREVVDDYIHWGILE